MGCQLPYWSKTTSSCQWIMFEFFTIISGMPQGSMLGPLLFIIILRWWASNVTQPCNNWRGFRFTAIERPSRSCRGHPWCHATYLVPRLFLGLYWPRSNLSATLYVPRVRTMTMPSANLGEIPCYFSVRLKNQLKDFNRNGLWIQLLH